MLTRYRTTLAVPRFVLPLLAILALTPGVAAPDDDPHEQLLINGAALDLELGVPERGGPFSYAQLDTEELLQQIGPSRRAIAGLKTPGRRRGAWGGKVLIDSRERARALAAVDEILGVEVLDQADELPQVLLTFADETALQRLRTSPWVDYVEPAFADFGLSSSDCDPEDYSTPPQRSSPIDPVWGDTIPWYFVDHRVPEAWVRSSGRGIRVAVVDTGVHEDQTDLRADFASGAVTNRQGTIISSTCLSCEPAADTCTHGTRVATTILAPRNGIGMVGIAYGAHMLSTKMGDHVALEFGANIMDVNRALGSAAAGARIVQMAWGSIFDHQSIADTIRLYHSYEHGGVLFVAAAGNHSPGVTFPARLPEVIAVSCAVNLNLKDTRCSYGPEVDFTASTGYQQPNGEGQDFPSLVADTSSFKRMGQTSGASSMVSGIAALTWAAFPNENREQIVNRLIAATGHSTKHPELGWGNISAYVAVGGFHKLMYSAPEEGVEFEQVTLTSLPKGLGPFRYAWSSGETTPTIRPFLGEAWTTLTRSVTVTDVVENKSLTTHFSVRSLPFGGEECDNPKLCR